MVKDLADLTAEQRRQAYERFLFELTIVARAVWSDPDLQDREKLDGLKWLNEIQHTVWGAARNPAEYRPSDLSESIRHCVSQAVFLGNVPSRVETRVTVRGHDQAPRPVASTGLPS